MTSFLFLRSQSVNFYFRSVFIFFVDIPCLSLLELETSGVLSSAILCLSVHEIILYRITEKDYGRFIQKQGVAPHVMEEKRTLSANLFSFSGFYNSKFSFLEFMFCQERGGDKKEKKRKFSF